MRACFRSRLGWVWLVVVGGLLVAGRLGWMVAWGFRVGLYVPGTRWLVLIPLALAGTIGLGCLRLAWKGAGQELELGSFDMTWRHHGRPVGDRWERILVSANAQRIRLTNGRWTVRLERAFFREYPRILKLINELHDDARQRERQVLAR